MGYGAGARVRALERGRTLQSMGPPHKARASRALVPHPDDAADVREAFDERRRDDFLSAEESAAYLHALGSAMGFVDWARDELGIEWTAGQGGVVD